MAEIYFLISPQNYPSSKHCIHRPAHFHIQKSDMYHFHWSMENMSALLSVQ